MAHIVIMGAGIGGVAAAIEVREGLAKQHQVTVVSELENFQFTPSNPWLAVQWRKPEELKVPLAPVFKKKKINFIPVGAKRVLPDENRLELAEWRERRLRLSRYCDRSQARLRGSAGTWTAWRTYAFGLHVAACRDGVEGL